MLLKQINGCKLFVETEQCKNPSELTTISFIREMWDKDKMVNRSCHKMHLTADEINLLKEAL